MNPGGLLKMGVRVQFEGNRVRDRADRVERRNLFRGAAWIRTAARRSIKPGKKPAAEGKPPHSHTKTLKTGIRFAYDPRAHSAVIGAVLVPGKQRQTGARAPEATEQGGRATITRRGPDGGRMRYTVTFGPRPFMEPAKEKAATEDKLAPFWKDTIRA